jgi:P-type Ca2+ transporter type 2C
VSLLGTDAERGLGRHEAAQRLARVGPNRIGEHRETPLWQLALAQFRSIVVLLLLGAAGIAWGLGERLEAIAIFAALVLNALIGFATEARARRSLSRLRALTVPHAVVRRDGRVFRLAAADLVPRDIILLEAGAHIPADARLLRSAALRVAEAALTGESEPVDKDADAKLEPGASLAERRTMVYLATSVVGGSGLAVVTATGLATELGRIGQLVGLAGERSTPLEQQVEQLGRRLIVLALAICGVVGLVGILHSEPVWLMLETAISLAIAAIPEGLPAMTTVALAAGLWRLARAGALVRRLPAVETLGSTTVICADKTGTITENRMEVVRIVLDGRDVAIAGGVEPMQAEVHGGRRRDRSRARHSRQRGIEDRRSRQRRPTRARRHRRDPPRRSHRDGTTGGCRTGRRRARGARARVAASARDSVRSRTAPDGDVQRVAGRPTGAAGQGWAGRGAGALDAPGHRHWTARACRGGS